MITTRAEIAALAAVVCAAGLLLTYEAWHTGVTIDEPSHLVSSRLYWQGKDRLRPQDMPPLIKLVGGWVPRLIELPLPPDLGKPGEDRREWEVGTTMMESLKPSSIQWIYFRSRLPMLLFPLATVVLLWWWTRQLFAAWVALSLAAAFALEPTALAHGALFKNDHAATFTHLLFWYCVWRYAGAPALHRALLVGGAAALAMLSKLSLLWVLGLAPLLILVLGRRVRAAAWAAGSVMVMYAAIVAAYQFDVRALTARELETVAATAYLPGIVKAAAHVFAYVPIPVSAWTGVVTLFSNLTFELPVYLLGRVWPEGNPWYFAVALAVKAPVALWIAILLGAAAVVWRAWRRQLDWRDLLWLTPGFLYIVLASRVPLQLGVRLVLPALPFGLLLAGAGLERWGRSRAGRGVLVGVAAVFAFEAVHIYPHGIAFFNFASGGPERGSYYLLDSNLDWGQGLPDLEKWARANNALPLRLSYFGIDMPFRYFRGNEVELLAPPWAESLVKSDRLVPEPDHYYAISPTLLPGQFFAPKFREYYAVFRDLTPVAQPGYSIFVYRVTSK